MKRFGYELDFISSINRDGSGTKPVTDDYKYMMNNDQFEINCLSISEKTFIASGFNSFIVKILTPNKPDKK